MEILREVLQSQHILKGHRQVLRSDGQMGEEGGKEMSCDNCEKSQATGMVAYFRWGKANIGLTGCDEHLKEIIEVLRKATADRWIKEAKKNA